MNGYVGLSIWFSLIQKGLEAKNVFLQLCHLARFHSKDPKIYLENRSTVIKETVIWSLKHHCRKPCDRVQKSFSSDCFVGNQVGMSLPR